MLAISAPPVSSASSRSTDCVLDLKLESTRSSFCTSSIDAAGAALGHRLLADAAGLVERRAGGGEVAARIEPAGVDRIHAHVGAIGFADRRLEDLLDRAGHLRPSGRQNRLPALEGALVASAISG